ncbi:glycosyltransferase [Zhongshania aliphaticivorans]|uniref:glycosyltransferase n=1 Tax=Zhongshania aliphaticivorans TaxID=1470434 RepID=UPI0012E499BC|nr:glycosyltransferase [Zhongshania aliphaticivorans]CAA0118115.1 Putative teichuronic acid biosynthesis glycosyltransferase TuaG [Zhongshania aliphaticivorans]
MNDILVLLATYNGRPWLEEQVNSVLAQQGVTLRLLIGDDCSTDGSIIDLKAMVKDDRVQIKKFDSSSGGAGQNFIRILSYADLDLFDYVAFSDQDDYWSPDKLSRAIGRLKSLNGDGYSSAVTAFWPDGKEQLLSQSMSETDIDFLFEGAGQGCTFVLRGDFAREIQFFIREHSAGLAGIHYHDWLVYALSRVMGKKWLFDPTPTMRYRQHSGNDTGARAALVGIRKRMNLIRNGWYADQVQQVIAVVSVLKESKKVFPEDFLLVWNLPDGIFRRFHLAMILLKRGRRRRTDRVVLAISSILGWL